MGNSPFKSTALASLPLMFVACGVLLASGCATTPTQAPGTPVRFIGCSGHLLPPEPIGSDPRVALAFFGAVLGYDAAVYGTCEADTLLYAPKAPVLTDGVYHSGYATFSVDLPSPPTGDKKPGINAIQPALLPADDVMFQLLDDGAALKSGAIAYGVGTAEEKEPELSEPLDLASVGELHSNSMTTGLFGQDESSLVHDEQVTLDGRPAIFAVYRSSLTLGAPGLQSLYLLTYFTRYRSRSAAIVIFWRGDCPVCKDGREADIRKLDPNIGRFVDSFHLDEAAIAKLKPPATGTHGTPETAAQAPLVSPSIPVPPGKALIYFYRESDFAGGGLNFHVHENGGDVGTLKNGSYFHTIANPGLHTFVLSAWRLDDERCNIQVKSGETRYLEILAVPAPDVPPLYVQMFVNKPMVMLTCREIADLDAKFKMEALKDAD